MAWSFTSLKTYMQCPRKYDAQYNRREWAPETEQIKWGNQVDNALEARAVGKPLPQAMSAYEWIGAIVDQAAAKGILVFAQRWYAIDATLRGVESRDPTCWHRGKMDLFLLGKTSAAIMDYKTGKPRDDQLQLRLYAASVMACYPQVQKIDAKFVWLQTKACPGLTMHRGEEGAVWREVVPLVRRMEEDRTFDPKPSRLCGWCHLKTSCEFHPEYKK